MARPASSVEQMTWCPGEPMLIPDKLFVAAGGWIERAALPRSTTIARR